MFKAISMLSEKKKNVLVLELTLGINYYFGKLNVFGYHLVNLLLHIFNGIMIYFILLYTLKSPVFSKAIKGKCRFMRP